MHLEALVELSAPLDIIHEALVVELCVPLALHDQALVDERGALRGDIRPWKISFGIDGCRALKNWAKRNDENTA